MEHVTLRVKTSSAADILNHFKLCGDIFYADLSSRADIYAYAEKIIEKAVRIEAWDGADLVGLLAFYNSDKGTFITHFGVAENYAGHGLSSRLWEDALVKMENSDLIRLEVEKSNARAITFYQKYGFTITADRENLFEMARIKQETL